MLILIPDSLHEKAKDFLYKMRIDATIKCVILQNTESNALNRHRSPDVKEAVVHAVREPLEMCVSAYQYHLLGAEPWLTQPLRDLIKRAEGGARRRQARLRLGGVGGAASLGGIWAPHEVLVRLRVVRRRDVPGQLALLVDNRLDHRLHHILDAHAAPGALCGLLSGSEAR